MTTVKAFNDMMGQFLDDILAAFPFELSIHAAKANPGDHVKFMKQVGPWVSQMMSKDPAFFCEENEFAKELHLHTIWHTPECTDASKAAIWQWLSSLYMIAMTLSMFPADALSQIEAVAEKCAKSMGANAGTMDEASLMAGVSDMLSTMMRGGGGSNPLMSMMGGSLPPLPETPRPKKKGNKKSR